MKAKKTRRKPEKRAYCFVSYSSREPQVQLLIECLRLAFCPYIEVKLTPSDLSSGTSQLKQIKQLIKNCLFAVVILDGFRPNVVFEFGMIVSIDRPLILLRENDAKVDVSTYYPNSANLNLTPVTIDLDNHLSDAKDLNYALWSRFKVGENVRLIIQEYEKIMRNRSGYIQIVREDLWFS